MPRASVLTAASSTAPGKPETEGGGRRGCDLEPPGATGTAWEAAGPSECAVAACAALQLDCCQPTCRCQAAPCCSCAGAKSAFPACTPACSCQADADKCDWCDDGFWNDEKKGACVPCGDVLEHCTG